MMQSKAAVDGSFVLEKNRVSTKSKVTVTSGCVGGKLNHWLHRASGAWHVLVHVRPIIEPLFMPAWPLIVVLYEC